MANWARLQEQLTGKRVIKRARHAIHFDNGDGTITANISGKPCHYQDTDGLWKAIDTKLLLLPDGFYGSPHSDVKIHKDGRVKAGGYQQKSALVDAKEGVVDGDKIVREFKFGTQYLYMKEDGFRQETVITRPPTTAEAKYLIASESGKLPSKYKRSDITAVDADGAVHEFVNLGQFKKWLDAAAYPVTIDPDFDASASLGDSWIDSISPTYQHGGYPASKVGPDHKTLMRFNLSSVTTGSVCTAASLHLFVETKINESATLKLHKVSDANGDWVTGTGLTGAVKGKACWNQKGYNTADWAGSAGLSTAGTDYIDTILASLAISGTYAVNTEHELTFNASGLAVLQDWFGDATNNGFVFTSTAVMEEQRHHSYEASTESYRPVLSVTYTAPGTLLKVNMAGQMQSLTGGFN